MTQKRSPLLDWTPEQIALGRRWVETWKVAAGELERIRRQELRALDSRPAIALLFSAEFASVPHVLRPGSGLVEQQRWFMRAARDY